MRFLSSLPGWPKRQPRELERWEQTLLEQVQQEMDAIHRVTLQALEQRFAHTRELDARPRVITIEHEKEEGCA